MRYGLVSRKRLCIHDDTPSASTALRFGEGCIFGRVDRHCESEARVKLNLEDCQ